MILTGVDECGRQVCNFGASDGILKDQDLLGQAGHAAGERYADLLDVVLKEGTWADRPGPEAIHRACDAFLPDLPGADEEIQRLQVHGEARVPGDLRAGP